MLEFSPFHPIVQLCLKGMQLETEAQFEQAKQLYEQAFQQASNDFERFLASWFLAKIRENASDRLIGFQNTLAYAHKVNDPATRSAYYILHLNIADCYEQLHDAANAQKHLELADQYQSEISDYGPFYHGTRAKLKAGEFLTAGVDSNYQTDLKMNHIYFSANLSAAGLAASLARGDGTERVYRVEPTGTFEPDPNLTNKKFPGNPTRSYRSEALLRIMDEVLDWVKQSSVEIDKFRDKLAKSRGEIIK